MADLRDVLIYLCENYPHPDELSRARLAKMTYLADWRSAITRGAQITDVDWIYNHYGPYVREVEEIAESDPAFSVLKTTNLHGHEKNVIRSNYGSQTVDLSYEETEVLDYVISVTAPMNWSDFVRLVYSTYPILTQPRYSVLNLVELAFTYKHDRKRFEWDVRQDSTTVNHAQA